MQQGRLIFKAGVLFQSRRVNGDNRNIGHAHIFQCLTDKGNIVCCTTAAARLGDEKCRTV